MICKFVGGKLDGKMKKVSGTKWIYCAGGENYYRSMAVPNTFFRDVRKALECNSSIQYRTS
jgi:hypothetical protein